MHESCKAVEVHDLQKECPLAEAMATHVEGWLKRVSGVEEVLRDHPKLQKS